MVVGVGPKPVSDGVRVSVEYSAAVALTLRGVRRMIFPLVVRQARQNLTSVLVRDLLAAGMMS